ncbi:MAG: pyridoxal 5'-phosphate synthase glutaminase subunit PdxT, partial [Candidatus Thermoplasmatota archaeon]|nr:pyridoxal 5'-phosphate synthase glutaminase subunit PdxT [Candidatus Thermoplasmatota archaeon]MBS3802711.1 pyridoxal 5'-phosphate synthase glutaminase subunit PdxT [Candidatus Thermoplasmatota archaeon]
MVKDDITIGVIGIQGAVSEHVAMMKQVFSDNDDVKGNVNVIQASDSLDGVDGVILPGGESTTISRVLMSSGLFDEIKDRVANDSLAIMGTCAGCILLASELEVSDDQIKLLELMNMKVQRNAYGRQKESFEQNLNISSIDSSNSSLFPAVFIRAPIITDVWDEKVKVLASDSFQKPVLVQQDNLLALTFHPELSNDGRIHSYFLSMVKR